MNPFPPLLLFFVACFFAWRLWRQHLDRKQARADKQMLKEEARHSLAAGDLSDCPRPVDREGRPTYGGWLYHKENDAERKTQPQSIEEVELHLNVEDLLKQAIAEADDH